LVVGSIRRESVREESRHTNNIGSQGIRPAAEEREIGKRVSKQSWSQVASPCTSGGLHPAPILGVGERGRKVLAKRH
jgi:hypothetical protein